MAAVQEDGGQAQGGGTGGMGGAVDGPAEGGDRAGGGSGQVPSSRELLAKLGEALSGLVLAAGALAWGVLRGGEEGLAGLSAAVKNLLKLTIAIFTIIGVVYAIRKARNWQSLNYQ